MLLRVILVMSEQVKISLIIKALEAEEDSVAKEDLEHQWIDGFREGLLRAKEIVLNHQLSDKGDQSCSES